MPGSPSGRPEQSSLFSTASKVRPRRVPVVGLGGDPVGLESKPSAGGSPSSYGQRLRIRRTRFGVAPRPHPRFLVVGGPLEASS